MATSGAARPCVQRALQTYQRSSLAPPIGPFAPFLLARHTTQQTRLASSKSLSPADRGTPTTTSPATAVELSGPRTSDPNKKKVPKIRRRPNRDLSKQRGLSVLRRTGPREHLSVSGIPLPRPVAAEDFPAVVKTDPAHGLWDFFYAPDKPLNTPRDDRAHGRAWNVEELRRKSWSDLHKLWWVCVKERNRIATGNWERRTGKYGYGDVESKAREMEVRKTQNAIKHALTERYYAWEDAVKLAKVDPEIEFTETGVNYANKDRSKEFLDLDEDESEWEDEEVVADEGTAEAESGDKATAAEGKPAQETVNPSISQNNGKGQQEAPKV